MKYFTPSALKSFNSSAFLSFIEFSNSSKAVNNWLKSNYCALDFNVTNLKNTLPKLLYFSFYSISIGKIPWGWFPRTRVISSNTIYNFIRSVFIYFINHHFCSVKRTKVIWAFYPSSFLLFLMFFRLFSLFIKWILLYVILFLINNYTNFSSLFWVCLYPPLFFPLPFLSYL